MKNTILTVIALVVMTVSCNQKSQEPAVDNVIETKTTSELYACPMHPEITGEKGAECSECGMELTEKVSDGTTIEKKNMVPASEKTAATTMATATFAIDAIISNYLKLKNALVNDDSNGAANAGKILLVTLKNVNTNSLDSKLKREYIEISDDAKEHSEHIGDNAGKIEHQREHFAMLSKDITDLIKTFGTTLKLYHDYCPMYDEGKSGYWISEYKEIKNPYFGAQMLNCGSVKNVF